MKQLTEGSWTLCQTQWHRQVVVKVESLRGEGDHLFFLQTSFGQSTWEHNKVNGT